MHRRLSGPKVLSGRVARNRFGIEDRTSTFKRNMSLILRILFLGAGMLSPEQSPPAFPFAWSYAQHHCNARLLRSGIVSADSEHPGNSVTFGRNDRSHCPGIPSMRPRRRIHALAQDLSARAFRQAANSSKAGCRSGIDLVINGASKPL